MAWLYIPADEATPTGRPDVITFWDRDSGGRQIKEIYANQAGGLGRAYANGAVPIGALDGTYSALIAVTDSPVIYRQVGRYGARDLISAPAAIADGSITLADAASDLTEAIGNGAIEELADVALSGDYADLDNLPSIPTTAADVGAFPDPTRRWDGEEWSARPTLPDGISAKCYSDGSNGSVFDVDATAPDGAVEGDEWFVAY